VFIGKGLCPDNHITPPGDGFVHCTSPMSYDGICKNQGPVNVTWYNMLLICWRYVYIEIAIFIS